MTEIRFAYDEEEVALRLALRGLMASNCPPEVLSAVYDGDAEAPDRIWAALQHRLGLGGLLVDEQLTAAGPTLGFAGVVLEELGRHVAPVPFLPSSVVAATVGVELADDGLKAAIATFATMAVLVPWSWSYADVAAVADVAADGRVTGRVGHVVGALEADHLVVPVVGPDGRFELRLVDATGVGVERRAIGALDMTRPLAQVQLDSAPSRLLGHGKAASAALRRGLAVATILLGSEQLGIADAVLDSTVEYLKVRRQFGRELGSFQALKHRVADMWVELEGLRAVARYGALGEGDALEFRASLVAAFASDVTVALVEDCLQLHGGIAMTWEHPLHFHLKRAKANQIALGSAGRHRALLGDLVDLPAAGAPTLVQL